MNELQEKLVYMIQTMDKEGLEQAYKILQRIWIRHGSSMN